MVSRNAAHRLKAGLPDSVINLVHGAAVAAVDLGHEDLTGVHFTGSTEVFDTFTRRVDEAAGL